MPRPSLAIAVVVFCVPSVALAAQLGVSGAGESIQDAIDNAGDGDVIFVQPGVYNEAIDFKGRLITLRSVAGPFETTIDASEIGGPVVVMSTQPAQGDRGEFEQRLEGFTLTGGSSDFGGGLHLAGPGDVVVADCIIEGNVANFGGGVFTDQQSTARIQNTIIAFNEATGFGTAIFANRSTPRFSNCTITDNTGSAFGVLFSVASVVNVRNSILFGNAPSGIFGVNPQIQFSCVQGGWPGAGNINTNPLFTDPEAGNYRPTMLSPCVDAGNNADVPGGVDLDVRGNDRIVAVIGETPIVDMGAIEYQGVEDGEPLPPIITSAPPGSIIIVRPGTYEGPIDFGGKAVTIKSTDGPESTAIIPPKGGGGPLVLATSGEGVGSILEGFTIVGGDAPRGGAMVIDGAQPTILNCIFRDNTATEAGGAIAIKNGTPDIINCVFIDNSVIFKGDAGGLFGGGAIVNEGSSPRITNCTFLRNDGGISGGAILNDLASAPFIVNCLLWFNTPDQISGNVGLVSYSNVEGSFPGPGNIDADPLVVDEFGRVDVFSPCIDAGDSSAFLSNLSTDLDGQPRFADDEGVENTGKGAPPIDIGAFEFQGTSVYCPEDISGDEIVGFADILAVLASWGSCDGCVEDVDQDGEIGFSDILRILAAWGPCPDAVGACCVDSGCVVVDQLTCEQQGGFFVGVGTNCGQDDGGIGPCETGACCIPFDGCMQLDEGSCFQSGGEFFGYGSDCADVQCALGACCLDKGGPFCEDLYDEGNCVEFGGIYQGDGTDCQDVICPERVGACCIFDGSCIDGLTMDECFSNKGEYRGDDTMCETEECQP